MYDPFNEQVPMPKSEVTGYTAQAAALTAEEARKISEANKIAKLKVEPFLEAIFAEIRRAASDGRRSIVNPFAAVRSKMPHEAEAEIWKRLESLGYKVESRNDDPGHPASRPYDVVSW